MFNIATGHATSLNAVLKAIGHVLGVAVNPRYEPARPGDIRHSLADVQAATMALGFSASTLFADGLRRTIDAVVDTSLDHPTAKNDARDLV